MSEKIDELFEKRMKLLDWGGNLVSVMFIFLILRFFHSEFGFSLKAKAAFQTIAALAAVCSWPFLFPMIKVSKIISGDPKSAKTVYDERFFEIRSRARFLTLFTVLAAQPVLLILGIVLNFSMQLGAAITGLVAFIVFFNSLYLLWR